MTHNPILPENLSRDLEERGVVRIEKRGNSLFYQIVEPESYIQALRKNDADFPEIVSKIAFNFYVQYVQREGLRFEAAKWVLSSRFADDPLAKDDTNALELARDLCKSLEAIDAALNAGKAHRFIPMGIERDLALATHARTIQGKYGKLLAEGVEKKSKDRLTHFEADEIKSWELHELWLPTDGEPARGVWQLADVLWRDAVRPRLAAPRFRISHVEHKGDSYAKLPKIVAPISWGMGAPGVVAEVDGDSYAQEPSIAPKIPHLTGKLIPRSWALLPKDHARRPHQTILPLELYDEPQALAVMVAQVQGYVIRPQTSKMALYMLASPDVLEGHLARATIEALTIGTAGESVQRIQQRDYEDTAVSLEELDWLHVYLPDETKFRIFSVRRPWTPKHAKPDMEAVFGIDPHFAEILKNGVQGGSLKGNEYDGSFLINLTGLMRLPNKRPALLRHYVRAAAHWNAYFVPGRPGVFDRARLPYYDLKEWGSITNCLPLAVVEYLRADPAKRKLLAKSRKVSASQAIKGIRDELDELHNTKLVIVEKSGDKYRMVPPRAYLDAKTSTRKGGTRPGK